MSLLRCRDIPEIANGYIDRETSVVEFAKVAAHLSTCTDCRTYVRSLRVTRALAADSLRSAMPSALKARLGSLPTPRTKDDEDIAR